MGVGVGQHYLVSFKLPFLTYQSNIRELWVIPQVLIGSGSVLEFQSRVLTAVLRHSLKVSVKLPHVASRQSYFPQIG